LKRELVCRDGPWPTRAGLASAVFEFIAVFYNRERRSLSRSISERPRSDSVLTT